MAWNGHSMHAQRTTLVSIWSACAVCAMCDVWRCERFNNIYRTLWSSRTIFKIHIVFKFTGRHSNRQWQNAHIYLFIAHRSVNKLSSLIPINVINAANRKRAVISNAFLSIFRWHISKRKILLIFIYAHAHASPHAYHCRKCKWPADENLIYF